MEAEELVRSGKKSNLLSDGQEADEYFDTQRLYRYEPPQGMVAFEAGCVQAFKR